MFVWININNLFFKKIFKIYLFIKMFNIRKKLYIGIFLNFI